MFGLYYTLSVKLNLYKCIRSVYMNKVRCVTFITSIAMLAGATIFSYPADVSAQNSQQDMRDISQR